MRIPTGRFAKDLLQRANRPTAGLGAAAEAMDAAAVSRALSDLGDAGAMGLELDRRVGVALGNIASLSVLSEPLAMAYLDRIRRPLVALTLDSGVVATTRGYVAHQEVENDPEAFGAGVEVPVLGNLPDFRGGRPPQDLLNRVVKATRRGFEQIRALPDDVWQAFVVCATGHAHEVSVSSDASGDETVEPLDLSVVDGLVRFGWVLRQVDLRYGYEPR